MEELCGRVDSVGNKCARPNNHKGRHLRKAVHKCHWPSCKVEVPPSLWGCKKHWFKLPKKLRDRIWATYRSGQEIDKRPSTMYLKISEEVQVWIAKSGAL